MKRTQIIAVALCCVFMTNSLHSQEKAEKLRQGFLLSGSILKRQFRDLAEAPRQSTVQFLENQKPVALGVIVGADGFVLTKASQIKDANRLMLSSNKAFAFKKVGYHADHDLALVKIDAAGLIPIVWESTEPVVGQWMLTIGIQRDPVGIGVMSVSRRKIGSDGTYGVLGIELERINEPVVKQVFANSGAQAAKLKAGDLILKVNEQEIRSGRSLIGKLRKHRPGDTLVITYERDGKETQVPVTLTHPFGDFLSRIAIQNQMGGKLSFRRDSFESVYQHDTVITPEECGGPVVNLDGKAFGINIARAGRTKSFVLPADIILAVLDDLKSGKLPPPEIVKSEPRPESPQLPESLNSSERNQQEAE